MNARKVWVLSCDARDCIAELHFVGDTLARARHKAKNSGWIVVGSNLKTHGHNARDFCSSHHGAAQS